MVDQATKDPAQVHIWSHRARLAPSGADALDAPRENSVPAFNRASTAGVDGIELDTWLSADGHFVVHHDRELPTGRLDQLRREQLPAELPILHDALDNCRVPTVNIELKTPTDATDDERKRLGRALALTLGSADTVVVSSFDLVALEALRAVRPDLRTGFLARQVPDPAELASLAEQGHWGLHVLVDHLAQSGIDACRAVGLAVVAWTVNAPDQMARLLAAGIDVIITDDPLRAMALRAGPD